MVTMNGSRLRARDSRRISDIHNIQAALEFYVQAHTKYPTSTQFFNTTSGVSALVTEGFISSMPKDPLTGIVYTYSALGTGTNCLNYHLGVALEDPNNKALVYDADAVAGTNCTGAADFSGLSHTVGGSACDTDPGTAEPGGTETCYDVKP